MTAAGALPQNEGTASAATGETARHGRLESLDGVRGLAAASVVGEHSMLVIPTLWAAFQARSIRHFHGDAWASVLTFTPLKIVWSGGAAVAIFFVLSGLVLSFPFFSGRNPPFWTFALKRIMRLYPTYLTALVLSWALFALFGDVHREGPSTWFQQNWVTQATAMDWLRAVFFLPGGFLKINSPLWSLIPEMRVSLIYPLLMMALIRAPRLTVLGSFATALVILLLTHNAHDLPPDLASILDTMSVVWLFVVGAYMGMKRQAIIDIMAPFSTRAVAALLVGCVVLLTASFTLSLPEAVSFFMTRGGAIALVFIIVGGRGPIHLLSRGVCRFLGEISYPLYAVHFPILYATVKLTGNLPLWLSIAIGIALSVPVAKLLAMTIESLAVRMAHRMGRPRKAGT